MSSIAGGSKENSIVQVGQERHNHPGDNAAEYAMINLHNKLVQ